MHMMHMMPHMQANLQEQRQPLLLSRHSRSQGPTLKTTFLPAVQQDMTTPSHVFHSQPHGSSPGRFPDVSNNMHNKQPHSIPLNSITTHSQTIITSAAGPRPHQGHCC